MNRPRTASKTALTAVLSLPAGLALPAAARTKKALLLAAASALATTGLLAPAPAASASASYVCTLEVTAIENLDLQEVVDDEIKVKLGSTMFGEWSFTANQRRTSSLGSPTVTFPSG